MQRTVKTIKMDVVIIENGKPETRTATFATPHKKEVERICKKKNILPLWETAERYDNLYTVDDDEFFRIAKLEKSVKIESEEVNNTLG